MAEKIRVRAKPPAALGRLTARNKGFIGYATCPADAPDVAHAVPGGNAYRVIPDGELVDNTSYIRNALRRGDLEVVTAEPAADAAEE